jgi:saccharopine dehydrogenase-like NADP-dependent oxidoreductase
MRVLALGGSGDMGRMAVAALLSSKHVTHITIADKNIDVANKYIALINSERLSAVEIDIMEEEKLSNIISKYDIVMNTIGPYYKFGTKILKIVIENKKHYADICDDWKPTLEMLKMDNVAKKSGITAIIGIGASPGISNLMAVKAASELDEVYEITTGWGLGNTKSGKKN